MKDSQRRAMFAKQNSSENFQPTVKQFLHAEKDWNRLRPIQRRSLLEMSLSDEDQDNRAIHDATDYIIYRNFSDLRPRLQKSITYMIGGY